MKIMATSFKISHACAATLIAPNPAAGHTNPGLCWRLLDTHRQVWVSLLWVHCSFLPSLGAHKVLFGPSKSLFSQSCVRSGSYLVGLMVTSSKRAYAVPKSAAPRAPVPVAVHCFLPYQVAIARLLLFTALPLLREYLPSVPCGFFFFFWQPQSGLLEQLHSQMSPVRISQTHSNPKDTIICSSLFSVYGMMIYREKVLSNVLWNKYMK